ncbi:MAG TPA: hypothetical protein VD973_01995 [Symbiobacteriaceae bacterium]|nr:hypothetical protein [Symbiobacteriaceae bacterium]
MTRILTDPEQLAALGAGLRDTASQLRSVSAKMANALGRLDWMAGARAEVEGQTALARQHAGQLGDMAEHMAQFLLARAELFRVANGQAVGAPPARLHRIEREGPSPTVAFGPNAPPHTAAPPPPARSTGRLVGMEEAGNFVTRVNAPLTNDPGQRDQDTYRGLLDQFNVETNPRYQERNNSTYCNVYVLDVLWAAGAEIPHANANGVAEWLDRSGEANGWKQVTAEQAQEWANKGYPTVAAYHGGGIEPGHLAMVRPGAFDQAVGPTIGQAGATNAAQTTAVQGFGRSRMDRIIYYVHE